MTDTGDLKVVITQKGPKWLVGVHRHGCDPVITTLDATGDDAGPALEQVAELVVAAKAKWEVTPLNPKGEVPKPAPPPPRATTTPKAAPTTKPGKPAAPAAPKGPQKPLF